MTAKKKTKQDAQKLLEEKNPQLKGINWNNFDIQLTAAFFRMLASVIFDPPGPLKSAMEHDPTSCCLHESICHHLQGIEIALNHLEEHCPDHPTPTPPEPTT